MEAMSSDRGMDKDDVVLIYNGILLSHWKEWNNAICSNMDGSRDYHTKLSKSDRERQISYDTAYMWNLKKKWYKWSKRWVTEQGGGWIWRGEWRIGPFSCLHPIPERTFHWVLWPIPSLTSSVDSPKATPLPGITSQINYLHSSLCYQGLFLGKPKLRYPPKSRFIKSALISTMWCWCKDNQLEQWNRTESRKKTHSSMDPWFMAKEEVQGSGKGHSFQCILLGQVNIHGEKWNLTPISHTHKHQFQVSHTLKIK